MILCTLDGKIIRMPKVACSDAQFYSSYWKNMYGVTFGAFGHVSGKTLALYAKGDTFTM
jgi:hypothetical protein